MDERTRSKRQRTGANQTSPYAGYFYPDYVAQQRGLHRQLMEPSLYSDVTIQTQSGMLEVSTAQPRALVPTRGSPSPWTSSAASSEYGDAVPLMGLGLTEVTSSKDPGKKRSHGLDALQILPSEPQILGSQSSTPTSEAIPYSSSMAMSAAGYPTSTYSGTTTPYFASEPNSAATDAFPPSTHFFHTDFLPPTDDLPPPVGGTASQLAAIEEEKRRRNTAASARFRVKKKERENALEKQAQEMTERVAVLEQKVSQLELENRWLRGLITEKSRKLVVGEGKTQDTKERGARKGSKGENDEEEVERIPGKRTDGVGTK